MNKILDIIRSSPHILEGYVRGTLNRRKAIMIYREEFFCQKCPLSHVDGKYTGVCQEENGGCGCKTVVKTAQSKYDCPRGFWTQKETYEEKFLNFINNEQKTTNKG